MSLQAELPYAFIIQTGSNYPQLQKSKKWCDGTMIITINPGSKSTESKPLRITENFDFDTEGSVRVQHWLPGTIGVPKLLKVDLESNKLELIKDALFVREITIIFNYQVYRFPIKNFVYPHNPLRGNPTVAKMGCPPHFLVREGTGTLKHQETEGFIIKAREEDLETIQSMVKWVDPAKEEGTLLYPGYLGVKDYDKLPRFLQFREAQLEMYLDLKLGGESEVKKNAIQNVLQKLVFRYEEERFDSFDHYKDHMMIKAEEMGWDKTQIYEAQKCLNIWQKDAEFGRQMLCGPHAIKLRKVESLEGRWKEGVERITDYSLEGKSPQQVLEDGHLFEVTTDGLIGVKHGGNQSLKITGTKQTWYVTLADCLLYQTTNGQMMPVLIRLENRNDGNPQTWWTPPKPGTDQEDPKYLKWLLAKMYFRSSDQNTFSLCAHSARAHGVGESFGVAAYRNLPNAHPILRLLQPHIQGIIPYNVQARVIVMHPEEGGFSMFLGVGDETRKVFDNYYKQFCYEELLFPKGVEDRGVKDIPEYLHRDDMMANWEIIESYVTEMVGLAYLSDEDVQKDEEIQNFCREIVEHGFRRFENGAGFPKSLSTKEKLIELLTAIIFNFSFYHASVNSQTFTYCFAPNFPTCMRMGPPSQDEVITMDRILDTLSKRYLPSVAHISLLHTFSDTCKNFEDFLILVKISRIF